MTFAGIKLIFAIREEQNFSLLVVESSLESYMNLKELYFQYETLFPRLNLWDFDVRFVQKINRSTDKCSVGTCVNSQINAVRPLHFY